MVLALSFLCSLKLSTFPIFNFLISNFLLKVSFPEPFEVFYNHLLQNEVDKSTRLMYFDLKTI
jgi:hypothetical protein